MAETLEAALDTVDQELDHTRASHDSAGRSTQDGLSAKTPQFARLTPTHGTTDRGLDHLHAVKLEAEVVLGRSTLSVDEMLNLGVGSVVELDRMVSEPVDLLVQNVRVARGEVVVLNDQFAIRITELVN
ncbi:MAG: FliM/FliN family flagellar motor switch protein [Planctomycetia bacterium]|nr:FliM/FliN family flagellar motor switch protein [Planctomycetia bacterium]